MNWKYLLKAIGVISMYLGLAALGMVGMFAVAYYVPLWLFLTLFFAGLFVFLVHTMYIHYKRMDEIKDEHKTWASEMSDKWDKMTR